MFNANSGLVRIWVNLINSGSKQLSDVPAISNLREIVTQVIEGDTND